MGDLCIQHEQPVTRSFPCGRPFVPSIVMARAERFVVRNERTEALVLTTTQN